MVRNLNDKFDSKVVCALKGIAIILMVCNHLYPIPEWSSGGSYRNLTS